MDAGIIFKAEINGAEIRRTPYFRVTKAFRMVSTAELRFHDTSFELFRRIKEGDKINITFGYRDGGTACFDGEVVSSGTMGKDTVRLIICGIDYRMAATCVCESYNDEQPAAVIKHLIEMSGLEAGAIDMPPITLPHMVFNSVSAWHGVELVRLMLKRNRLCRNPEYWLYKEKFYFGELRHGVTHTADISTILSHTPEIYRGKLELGLTPLIDISETLDLVDERRGIKGMYTIRKVEHLIDGTKTRTYVEY